MMEQIAHNRMTACSQKLVDEFCNTKLDIEFLGMNSDVVSHFPLLNYFSEARVNAYQLLEAHWTTYMQHRQQSQENERLESEQLKKLEKEKKTSMKKKSSGIRYDPSRGSSQYETFLKEKKEREDRERREKLEREKREKEEKERKKLEEERKRKELEAKKRKEAEENKRKELEEKSRACPYDVTGYCRSYNLKFHPNKCKMAKYHKNTITKSNTPTITPVDANGGVFATLQADFVAHFKKMKKQVTVTQIRRIENPQLKTYYNAMNRGNEQENIQKLYHGTSEAILAEIYSKGFMLPADFEPSPQCPISGKAKVALCTADCTFCTKKHVWDQNAPCHMYGLGLYFANDAEKSDHYVSDRNWNKTNKVGKKMLLCEVNLGRVFTIQTHLKKQDEYHDSIVAPNGYDTIHAVGLGSGHKRGFSVNRDEFIVFNPHRALPKYEFTYNIA